MKKKGMLRRQFTGDDIENGLERRGKMITYTDEFKNIASCGFVIFGAGGKGQACYDMLKLWNQEQNIRFFVDNNPLKQNTIFNEKKVIAPQDLKKLPQLPIVIAAFDIGGIYRRITDEMLDNPVFVFRIFSGISSVHTLKKVADEVFGLYDDKDEYTKKLIEMMSESGNAKGLFEIQPFETAKNVLTDCRYWTKEGTKLYRYDEITLIDAGAYVGDTLLQMRQDYPKKVKRYYGFEPDPDAFSKLEECIAYKDMGANARIYNLGLSDEAREISFRSTGKGSSRIDMNAAGTGQGSIKVVKLDDLEIDVKGKLCIKMDIEGSELAALKGAVNLIKEHKPELAVCLYHLTDDAYTIAKHIKSILPEYKLIIRDGRHAVCYGVWGG